MVYRKNEASARKKILCKKSRKLRRTKCFKRRKSKQQIVDHLEKVDNFYPPTTEHVPDRTSQNNSMGWLAHIKTAQLDSGETEDNRNKDCSMRLPTMGDLNFQTNSSFATQAYEAEEKLRLPTMIDLDFQTQKVSSALSVKTNTSSNQVNKSKDVHLAKHLQNSETSVQKYRKEIDPKSTGSTKVSPKAEVDNFSEKPVIFENTCSSMDKSLDNTTRTLHCEKCKESSSEIKRLNLLISAIQNNLDTKTNELSNISKALDDEKLLNKDLKSNLDKQIEKSELLTNQKFEEELRNIFLESSILGRKIDEGRTKKLFQNPLNDEKTKMIEESTKKLAEISKKLSQAKNNFFKPERKLRESANLVIKESCNKLVQSRKERKRKSPSEKASEPQGLLVPKLKRIKLETKDRDFSNVKDSSISDENSIKINQLKSHIIEYENRIETFNRTIQNFQELIAEKDTLVKSLRKDLETAHSEKEKLKQNNLLLSEERDKLEQDNAKTLHSNELLRCKISNFSSNTVDKQKNQKELEQVNLNLEKLKQENKLLAEEKQKLEKQIINIDEIQSEKDKTIEFLRSKIENFASNTVDRQRKTEELNDSINSLTKENTDLKKEISLLKVKEDNLKFEQEKAKEESDKFHEELIEVRKELEKCKKDLEERKKLEKRHSLEILQIKEKYKTSASNNVATKEDNDMLHQELQKSKDELEKACEALQKRQEVEEKTVEKLNQLREELEKRRCETSRLQKELLVKIKECADANERLSHSEKSIKNYGKEFCKMKQELALNAKSLTEKNDKMNKQQNYIRHLEAEFVMIQEKRKMFGDKIV